MNEKVLIKSECYNVKKLLIALIILGVIFALIIVIGEMIERSNEYDYARSKWELHQERGYCYKKGDSDQCWYCRYPSKKVTYLFDFLDYFYLWIFSLPIFASFTIIGVLIYFALRSYELVVTDKRVYGRVAWGKQVDLPADSITATATLKLFRGIAVSTASGRIKFLLIKNAKEIYKVLNELIIARQDKIAATEPDAATQGISMDDIIKLKSLLDQGIITQEEFDAKKKQILGL